MVDFPQFPLGEAVGPIYRMTGQYTPQEGEAFAVDGATLRQNMLILGGEPHDAVDMVIQPLTESVLAANWGEGHKNGAYVTDYEGNLWRTLLSKGTELKRRVAEDGDVFIVGTDEGQYGVDLLANRTPGEVTGLFRSVIKRFIPPTRQPDDADEGDAANESTEAKEARKAAETKAAILRNFSDATETLLRHCAVIARVLDADPGDNEVWTNCRPWSVLGIVALATNDALRADALNRVRPICEAAGEDDLDALNSYWFLTDSFASLEPETASNIQMVVSEVFGSIASAGALRDRFFTGMWPTDKTVSLTHAINGGVILNAIGDTVWGKPGLIASLWMKGCLGLEAKARLMNDRNACNRSLCAVVVGDADKLLTREDVTALTYGREAGTFLIAAAPSLAALHRSLGDRDAGNLVSVTLAKVILPTEDTMTLNYSRKFCEGAVPCAIERGFAFVKSPCGRDSQMGLVKLFTAALPPAPRRRVADWLARTVARLRSRKG